MECSVVELRAALREGIKPNSFLEAGSSVHTNTVSHIFKFGQYISICFLLLFTNDLTCII